MISSAFRMTVVVSRLAQASADLNHMKCHAHRYFRIPLSGGLCDDGSSISETTNTSVKSHHSHERGP